MKKSVLFFTVLFAAVSALTLNGCSGPTMDSIAASKAPAVSTPATTSAGSVSADTTVVTKSIPLPSSGNMVDITDSLYADYVNDIYCNTDNYMGKTIRIQGAFSSNTYEYNGKQRTVYFVSRTISGFCDSDDCCDSDGCCGCDGCTCGFEFTYDGKIPKDNDWIEVVGVLSSYDEGGNHYLTLKASSVKVLPKRGQDVVSY